MEQTKNVWKIHREESDIPVCGKDGSEINVSRSAGLASEVITQRE